MTNVEGHPMAHPVNVLRYTLWFAAKSSDHELAEGAFRQSLEPGDLVDAPVLNSEIGCREQFPYLFLDGSGNPVRDDCHCNSGLITGDPPPIHPLGYGRSCAPTTEEVRDRVALVGGDLQHSLDQGFRLLSGVADALLADGGDDADFPDIREWGAGGLLIKLSRLSVSR